MRSAAWAHAWFRAEGQSKRSKIETKRKNKMQSMKRLSISVGAVALLAMLLAVTVPKATRALVAALVQVTNTTANPVPVSDVAPVQAFVQTCRTIVTTGAFAENECNLVVPAGQRWVVQTVSVQAIVDLGVTVTSAEVGGTFGGTSYSMYLNATPTGTTPGGGAGQYNATQELRFYSDPGIDAFCVVGYSKPTTNNELNCTFTGYSVPLP
jgi:hypothetical protein